MELENFQRSTVIENKWLTLLEDKYRLPNGADCTYYHALQSDTIMAIALEKNTAGLSTYIVNQYRHPIGQTIWQFPLGGFDPNSQDPVDAAKRELVEETGIKTGSTRYMGAFFANPGFSNQRVHVCISTEITTLSRPRLEETEYGLVSRRVAVADLEGLVNDGTMGDAWGITGLHYIKRFLSEDGSALLS